MSSIVEHSVKKPRLSLSLKRSNVEATTIKTNESDNNEELNKFSTCKEADTTSSNNKTTINDEYVEEEIIPCSQTEDNLVFTQSSLRFNGEETQVNNNVPEQKKEKLCSAETLFSGEVFSLKHDQSNDSSIGEDKVNNIQDNSTDIFNSPEAKVSETLNERKNSERMEMLNTDIKGKDNNENSRSKISSSLEVDVCTIIDERKDNEKKECFGINEETIDVQEGCNEIPNSPEAKIIKILKENEDAEESKCCEKKYNNLPPIIKRNVVIADSDEEFEEFVNQKRKSQKKIENTNTSNSQKENSTSKSQEQTKVSSSSCKEKSKVLKSHRDKSNVSKTSKEKSKNVPSKRKLEYAIENSDDEFEKPNKRAKKIQSPSRASINKEVKKSKKLKKSRKSISLSTENY